MRNGKYWLGQEASEGEYFSDLVAEGRESSTPSGCDVMPDKEQKQHTGNSNHPGRQPICDAKRYQSPPRMSMKQPKWTATSYEEGCAPSSSSSAEKEDSHDQGLTSKGGLST